MHFLYLLYRKPSLGAPLVNLYAQKVLHLFTIILACKIFLRPVVRPKDGLRYLVYLIYFILELKARYSLSTLSPLS